MSISSIPLTKEKDDLGSFPIATPWLLIKISGALLHQLAAGEMGVERLPKAFPLVLIQAHRGDAGARGTVSTATLSVSHCSPEFGEEYLKNQRLMRSG